MREISHFINVYFSLKRKTAKKMGRFPISQLAKFFSMLEMDEIVSMERIDLMDIRINLFCKYFNSSCTRQTQKLQFHFRFFFFVCIKVKDVIKHKKSKNTDRA